MDDHLLDTSWSLHHVTTNTPFYRDFFARTSTQTQLAPYIDRLTRYITSHTPQYIEDLDNEREKLGALKGCKLLGFTTTASTPDLTASRSAIGSRSLLPQSHHFSIQIIYQNQTHRYILYSPSLILSKSPQSHTKKLIDFLSDTFDGLLVEPLRLPPDLLSSALAAFISTVTEPTSPANTTSTATTPTNELDRLALLATLKHALGTLKLTISFSSPVAPNLRTLDIDVPYDTVASLLSHQPLVSSTTTSSTSNDKPASATTTQDPPGPQFLNSLTHHIHQKTGLILAFSPAPPSPSSNTTTPSPPFHLSKILTASFAISAEGRLKFSTRPSPPPLSEDGGEDGMDTMGRAREGITALVDTHARSAMPDE